MIVLLSIVVSEKVKEDDCEGGPCGTCQRAKLVQPNEDDERTWYFTCTKCSEKYPNGKKIYDFEKQLQKVTLGELSCTRALPTGGIVLAIVAIVGFFSIVGGVFAYCKWRNRNKGNNREQNTENGDNTQNDQLIDGSTSESSKKPLIKLQF